MADLFKKWNKAQTLIQQAPRDLLRMGRHKFNLSNKAGLAYYVPNASWATDWVGRYIVDQVQTTGLNAFVTSTPQLISDYLLHYADLGSFIHNVGRPHNKRNKVIATVFHGYLDGQNKQLIANIEKFIKESHQLESVVTASSIMQSRLTEWLPSSVPVYCLPIGIDGSKFRPASVLTKSKLRDQIGIPQDAFCIGSFQKDGVGWGKGDQPKLIKGPDVFIETLSCLKSLIPNLFVILTAPARGYVMNGLRKCGIPYVHHVLGNYLEINSYYQLLDCYLVASREEGGPKSILESMSAGVPLVTTRVGMAPDIVNNGVNGYLCDVEDVAGLAAAINQVAIMQPNQAEQIIANGVKTASQYDWSIIGQQYVEQVYKPLIAEG